MQTITPTHKKTDTSRRGNRRKLRSRRFSLPLLLAASGILVTGCPEEGELEAVKAVTDCTVPELQITLDEKLTPLLTEFKITELDDYRFGEVLCDVPSGSVQWLDFALVPLDGNRVVDRINQRTAEGLDLELRSTLCADSWGFYSSVDPTVADSEAIAERIASDEQLQRLLCRR